MNNHWMWKDILSNSKIRLFGYDYCSDNFDFFETSDLPYQDKLSWKLNRCYLSGFVCSFQELNLDYKVSLFKSYFARDVFIEKDQVFDLDLSQWKLESRHGLIVVPADSYFFWNVT